LRPGFRPGSDLVADRSAHNRTYREARTTEAWTLSSPPKWHLTATRKRQSLLTKRSTWARAA